MERGVLVEITPADTAVVALSTGLAAALLQGNLHKAGEVLEIISGRREEIAEVVEKFEEIVKDNWPDSTVASSFAKE